MEVVGWGVGKESWGIRYQKILGNTLENQVWADLDTFLQTSFHKKDGTALRIAACCIDSGYRSNQVYSFTVDKFDRHVFAIKGKGGQGVPYIRNPSKDNRVKTPLFTIGVDAGKDFIHQRLRVVMKGSNYCHFPLDEGTEPLDLRNYATAALEIYNPPLQKPEQGAEQRPRRLGRRVLSGGI